MANYDLTYEGSEVQRILDTGDSLKDAGYIFRGEATTSTVPGTPTERVAYIGGPGTYTNFGGSITVGAGCVCIFKYTGSAWSNQVINTGLSDAISSEAQTRSQADTALQNAINAINNNIGNGYVYAGVATPSTSPVTGKVFYLAVQAGTYTNFGSAVVTAGLNVLKYNGSAWSVDQVVAIDAEPTQGSDNLVKSGGVLNSIIQNGPAFDLSAYNAQGGTLATYADLSAALTALNALPADFKKGGMSFRFVLTSDNKYVQFRCMAQNFITNVTQWQGVDSEIKSGSKNLAESGAVSNSIDKIYGLYQTQIKTAASAETVSQKQVSLKTGLTYTVKIKKIQDVTTSTSAHLYIKDGSTIILDVNIGNNDTEYTRTLTVNSDTTASVSIKYTSHVEVLIYSLQDLDTLYGVSKFAKDYLPLLSDIDSVPTEDSVKLVKSGGVFAASKFLNGKKVSELNILDSAVFNSKDLISSGGVKKEKSDITGVFDYQINFYGAGLKEIDTIHLKAGNYSIFVNTVNTPSSSSKLYLKNSNDDTIVTVNTANSPTNQTTYFTLASEDDITLAVYYSTYVYVAISNLSDTMKNSALNEKVKEIDVLKAKDIVLEGCETFNVNYSGGAWNTIKDNIELTANEKYFLVIDKISARDIARIHLINKANDADILRINIGALEGTHFEYVFSVNSQTTAVLKNIYAFSGSIKFGKVDSISVFGNYFKIEDLQKKINVSSASTVVRPNYELINFNYVGWSDFTIVDDKFVFFSASADDHTDYAKLTIRNSDFSLVRNLNHNFGHCNTVQYRNGKILIGNLPGNTEYPQALYIIQNADNLITQPSDSNVNFTDWVKVINLSTQGSPISGGNVCACFGENNYGDDTIVYIFTAFNKNIYRIILGKGSNQLDYGDYDSNALDTEYNGTWNLLEKYNFVGGDSDSSAEVIQGIDYYDGKIITANGHNNGIAYIWNLKANGTVDREKMEISLRDEDGELYDIYTEGITIKDGAIYQGVLRLNTSVPSNKTGVVKYKVSI